MTLSGLLAALGAERSFANIRTQAALPPGERSAETVISAPDGMRPVLTAQLRAALDEAGEPQDSAGAHRAGVLSGPGSKLGPANVGSDSLCAPPAPHSVSQETAHP